MAEAITNQTSVGVSGGKTSLGLGRISLATANRVLGVLVVLAFVYFVATILIGGVKLAGVGQHIRGLEAKGAQAAKPAKEVETATITVTDPALSNRNIFQPSGIVTASSDSGVVSTGAAGGYQLVGISQSSDPAETYVMIESSRTKLTYFLQYGQPVEGLELERILEDKVIVKIGGKSVELE